MRVPRPHWTLLLVGLGFLLVGLLVSTPFTSNDRLYVAQAETKTDQVPLRASQQVAFTPDGHTVAGIQARPGHVALTFDDGPDPRWTPAIQQVLDRHGVKATFFELGSQVVQHPQTARALARDGQEIGLHTFTHVNLSVAGEARTKAELAAARMAVEAATGHSTVLVRPPFSSTAQALDDPSWAAVQQVARDGYTTVLATQDVRDWSDDPEVSQVAAKLRAARAAGAPGQVVLLHDGGGNREHTVAVVDQLVTQLQRDGWQVGTVGETLGMVDTMPAVAPGDRAVDVASVAGLDLAAWTVRIMTFLVLVAGFIAVARALLLLLANLRHRRLEPQRPRRGSLGPVTIVVPAYNEELGIGATIRSLAASTHPVQVVVVDDGSTDATARVARDAATEVGVDVRVVQQANGGKAAALNTGLAATTTELVVMVDGDTVFQPDTVAHLVAPLADERVGAVSGNAKVANRTGLLGRWQHIEYVLGFNMDRRLYDLADCMPTVPGAVGAFRTSALREVGGLAVDTLAEDTDLTMALGCRGWLVRYAPRAVAWTEAPASFASLWRQRYRWSYGTMQAMWKHAGALRDATGQQRRYLLRSLGYMVTFQVLFPLLAPAVDLFALYGLYALQWRHMVLVWLFFLAVDLVLAITAFRADREPLRPLWALPLTQVVYRQLMYLVVIHSLATAITGVRLKWQRMERYGTHEAAVVA